MTRPAAALARLQDVHGALVEETHQRFGDATAVIAVAGLGEVMSFLRDDPALGLDMLMDLTAVDHHPKTPRFEAIYHLYSSNQGHRVRIKARLDDTEPSVPSVTSLWASADWMEREAFDMYGIHFEGHPDLRRILLYDEFEGHPLRKDYPKTRRQPLIGPTDR